MKNVLLLVAISLMTFSSSLRAQFSFTFGSSEPSVFVGEPFAPGYYDPYYNRSKYWGPSPVIYSPSPQYYETKKKSQHGKKVTTTTTIKNQRGQVVYENKKTTNKKKKK